MEKVTLTAKLDTTGGYRIKWHEGQYWIVGHGVATACGTQYTSAKFVLEGMLESPPLWTPLPDIDFDDPDLNEFGRGLADV